MVLLRKDATEAQLKAVVEAIEAHGLTALPLPGGERTAVGIPSAIPPDCAPYWTRFSRRCREWTRWCISRALTNLPHAIFIRTIRRCAWGRFESVRALRRDGGSMRRGEL
jgi:hypothetical protein